MPRSTLIQTIRRCLVRVNIALGVVVLMVALCAVYARYVEPHWLRVRHVRLSATPTVRLVQVSDIHFKGDAAYLEKVVRTINRLDADAVCFTGDLVEDAGHLDAALRIMAGVNKPIYGIPGNHDRWALGSCDRIAETFRRTGGGWLEQGSLLLLSNRVELVALGAPAVVAVGPTAPGVRKRVLLEHDPAVVAHLHGLHFDLILSGHTHGGQVRLPIIGPLLLPYDVGPYDRGLFQTASGPLYVNPGIGAYYVNLRFLCRPEITVFEL